MPKLLTLVDLPDDPTPAQIMQLNRNSLDQLAPTRVRWRCQVKGCDNGTHLLDFGIHPFYMLARNSKASRLRPDKHWRKLDYNYLVCGKHVQRWKTAVARYGHDAVIAHMMHDPDDIAHKLPHLITLGPDAKI